MDESLAAVADSESNTDVVRHCSGACGKFISTELLWVVMRGPCDSNLLIRVG